MLDPPGVARCGATHRRGVAFATGAATARSEATVLRAALDRECARADRYEAELARLRKPLWERVLEAVRRR